MTYLPVEPSTKLATKSDITALDTRFDEIDQRFEQIDQRFDEIDQRWENRFQILDDRLYGLQDVFRDQLKAYTITMVGGMTALTAIYAGLLTIVT
jgi:thymidylate kinase